MTESSMHPCARCARMQKTCCQHAEIVLTDGDIARITAHTGRPDFWSRQKPTNPAYLLPDPADPNWLPYTTDASGHRRMLNRHPDGDCGFLGPAGCTLPVDVRPLVCRLYPFAYNETGMTGIDDEYCPTEVLLPKDQPGITMLTVLGMSPAEGESWRAMLYAELRQSMQSPKESPCASA